MSLVLVAGVVFAPGARSESESPFRLVAIKGDERDVNKVPPIKVPGKPPLYADFMKVQDAWAERVLVRPAIAQMQGKPFAPAAASFLLKAVRDLYSEHNTVPWDKEICTQLRDEGKKLIAAGCDDPLVLYLVARFELQISDDWRAAKATMEELVKRLKADTTRPKALLVFIGKEAALANWRGHYRDDKLLKRVTEFMREAFKDGSYRPEDAEVFLEHTLGYQWDDFFAERMGDAVDVVTEAGMPQWLAQTLRGHLEIKLAWNARGSGWASEVTEKGSKEFGEHMEVARRELTESWKAHPTNPWAAGKMITVLMGGGSVGEDSERLWFDRAIAARFDHWPAYAALILSMRPRWGGSVEEILAFGRAARDTGRYDTLVPGVLHDRWQ